MINDVPKWFTIAFFSVTTLAMIMCLWSLTGCSREEDDSLDKISQEVLKKDKGIDIEFRPIAKEPR